VGLCKPSVLVHLRRALDTKIIAVWSTWLARAAARRILFALAFLVSSSKLASTGQFEQIGTSKSQKHK
jgi:hypothetical protein